MVALLIGMVLLIVIEWEKRWDQRRRLRQDGAARRV